MTTDLISKIDAAVETALTEQKPPVYLDRGKGVLQFGIFLFQVQSQKQEVSLKGISPEAIRRSLRDARIYRREIAKGQFIFVQDSKNRIKEILLTDIARIVRDGIEQRGAALFDYRGLLCDIALEQFLDVFGKQQSQLFTAANVNIWLDNDTRPILDSEEGCSRFFFRNGVAEVRRTGISMRDYSEFPNHAIWLDAIKDSDFTPLTYQEAQGCEYSRFLHNVAGTNYDQFRCATGYLLSGYKRPQDTQTIILNDCEATDKDTPQGGSGKGLFSRAIREMVPTAVIDGKGFCPDDKFRWQRVELSTKVLNIDDLRKGIPFETFHSISSEGIDVEKKFCGTIRITEERAPKLLISSNSVFVENGTTNSRRQHILEFTNHYSKQIAAGESEPVIKEFGHSILTREWDAQEWNRFRNFSMFCVMSFMANGLIQPVTSTVEQNKILSITGAGFISFMEDEVLISQRYGLRHLCQKFNDSDLKDTINPISTKTFFKWIKLFAGWKKYEIVEEKTNGAMFFGLYERKRSK